MNRTPLVRKRRQTTRGLRQPSDCIRIRAERSYVQLGRDRDKSARNVRCAEVESERTRAWNHPHDFRQEEQRLRQLLAELRCDTGLVSHLDHKSIAEAGLETPLPRFCFCIKLKFYSSQQCRCSSRRRCSGGVIEVVGVELAQLSGSL